MISDQFITVVIHLACLQLPLCSKPDIYCPKISFWQHLGLIVGWSESDSNRFYLQDDKVATDTSRDIEPETTGAVASETEVSLERILAFLLTEQPNFDLNPHSSLGTPLSCRRTSL